MRRRKPCNNLEIAMSKQILNQDAVEIITTRLIQRPQTATDYQGAPNLLDDRLYSVSGLGRSRRQPACR